METQPNPEVAKKENKMDILDSIKINVEAFFLDNKSDIEKSLYFFINLHKKLFLHYNYLRFLKKTEYWLENTNRLFC